MSTALEKLNLKLETLTNQCELLEAEISEIEQKRIKLSELLERVKDLQLCIEAVEEEKQAVRSQVDEDMKAMQESFNTLVTRFHAGNPTESDFREFAEGALLEMPIDETPKPEPPSTTEAA